MILNEFSFTDGKNDIVCIEITWFYTLNDNIHYDVLLFNGRNGKSKYLGDCIEEM